MENLLKISLAISITGIFLLLFLTMQIQPKEIASYTDLRLNEYVKVTGKIISIRNYDDFSIIKLGNNITLTCNCKFQVNETITAAGKITEYNNQLQIQVDKIKNDN